ncbi:DUF2877 domain-containing protein [Nakamurella lactea]|uniref:DUF2877 domain-containing protein n=1 Tax=Nakamurella lactea TaxID=459515 RepID=UPI000414AA96|nr:DUF2877 domain-containing protein [Nakamurella lactea]
MTSRPVAAAAPLTPLLTGPPTAGSVLAVFRSAALLAVNADGAGPRIVALLSLQAGGSPNGVRVPLSAHLRPFAGLRAGQPVTLGAREIVTTSDRYRLARTWRTAVPAVRSTAEVLDLVSAHAAGSPIGVPRQRVSELAAALAGGDPAATDLRPAVRGLVGLGKGLTPGGDDVLAGLMVGLRAAGRRLLLQQVRQAIGPDAADRTTAVSVDLLRLAAAGHGSTEALRLLGAIHAIRDDPNCDRHRAMLRKALDALLGIGHTSGADLLTGLVLGLTPSTRLLPRPSMPGRTIRFPINPTAIRKVAP